MKAQEVFKDFKLLIKEYGETYHTLMDEDLFTLWFLRTYVNDNEQESAKSVVNGPNDKGIDAIHIDDNARAIFLVQAKYRKRLNAASEKANDVKQFAELSHVLGRYDHSDFKIFIENADSLVKDRLNEARRKIHKRDYKLWLYYATLGKCSSIITNEAIRIVRKCGIDGSLEIFDGKRLMLIYQDYLDGVAPPIPTLDLKMEKGGGIDVRGVMERYDKPGKIESWVFPMRGSDIGSLFETSGVRLFARNIRGFLGKATKINRSMQATLEEEPENFFYYNNGVTIICDHAKKESEKGRDILRVRNPQIINGQQTTRTLSALPIQARKASVLIKVIQVPRDVREKEDGFESLVSAIVQGTNWQNPVKQSDLVVNDRKQIEIERELRKLGYLYLRKRQSKSEAKRVANVKYLKTIKKEEIARAVVACEMDPMLLRLGVENFFSEEQYHDVFPNVDPNFYLPRYWLMWHTNKVAKRHTQGGFSKWLVLNFMWSRFAHIVRASKRTVTFRKLCEKRDDYLYRNLHRAIDKVFIAARKYYLQNKGSMTFLDFFKAKKGRDKEFQKFWQTPANKSGRLFDKYIKKVEEEISE